MDTASAFGSADSADVESFPAQYIYNTNQASSELASPHGPSFASILGGSEQSGPPSPGGDINIAARRDVPPSQADISSKLASATELLRSQPIAQLKALVLPAANRRSPFFLNIPTAARPITTLTRRLHAWIKVLKSLVHYFQMLAVSSQQLSKIHLNMCEAVNFPMFTNGTSKGFNYQELIRTPTDLRDMVNGPTAGARRESTSSSDDDDDDDDDDEARASGSQKYPIVNQPVEKDDKAAQTNFLPFGSRSIQDVPNVLINYHKNLSLKNLNLANELTNLTIPRLEELRRDLQQKIREIKTLHDDFRNNLKQEIALTGQRLFDYLEVLSDSCYQAPDPAFTTLVNPTNTTAAVNVPHSNNINNTTGDAKRYKKDPFLLKFKLDYQLKNQILQESYLQEAYINLQTTAADLEKIITSEIQRALNSYVAVIDSEVKLSYELIIKDLGQQGFLSKPYYQEWNSFIDRDNNQNFLKDIKVGAPVPKSRKVSDVEYPFKDNFISKCIKTGYMNKKSKFLKNYRRCFYLLTVSSLFEFASEPNKPASDEYGNSHEANNNISSENGDGNGDGAAGQPGGTFHLKNATPTASYNLNYCSLGPFDYSKNKFIMYHNTKKKRLPDAKGIDSDYNDEVETHKIAFKLNDQKELLLWYNYLKQLLKFKSPYERAVYIEKRYLKSVTNKKLKSGEIKDGITISSDGTFNRITNQNNNIVDSSNNNSSSTINNQSVSNNNNSKNSNENRSTNASQNNKTSTTASTGQLQGIAPEIIISDLSFVENQTPAKQHAGNLQRPPSIRSSSASLFGGYIDNEDEYSAASRSPPLAMQYNYYSQMSNGSTASFIDSPPGHYQSFNESPSSNASYTMLPTTNNNNSNSGGLKVRRPMMRLTNSTSNIHEGSLKNKLGEINVNKAGKRNKFMGSLFTGHHSNNSSTSSLGTHASSKNRHQKHPSLGSLQEPPSPNIHKSSSLANMRQAGLSSVTSTVSSLNLLGLKKREGHQRTMSGI